MIGEFSFPLIFHRVKILKRKVLSGYWGLLNNRGPVADKRVRVAMNYAINKQHLVTYADFSNAVPLASLGKSGEFGANAELRYVCKSYYNKSSFNFTLFSQLVVE